MRAPLDRKMNVPQEERTPDPSDHDICECGDGRLHHVLGRGPCLICRAGNKPWDNCDRFRLSWPTEEKAP